MTYKVKLLIVKNLRLYNVVMHTKEMSKKKYNLKHKKKLSMTFEVKLHICRNLRIHNVSIHLQFQQYQLLKGKYIQGKFIFKYKNYLTSDLQ